MQIGLGWLACALSIVAACASGPPPPPRQTYSEALAARPMPQGAAERIAECQWIRSEIAREGGLAELASSRATDAMTGDLYRAIAAQNIAALESRASVVRCGAAFSDAPSAEQNFDSCFQRCREYTERSNEQCFDACNH